MVIFSCEDDDDNSSSILLLLCGSGEQGKGDSTGSLLKGRRGVAVDGVDAIILVLLLRSVSYICGCLALASMAPCSIWVSCFLLCNRGGIGRYWGAAQQFYFEYLGISIEFSLSPSAKVGRPWPMPATTINTNHGTSIS